MSENIKITRKGYYLAPFTQEIPGQKSYWYNSYADKFTEQGTAKIISPRLARYQYSKRTQWDIPRYHIIHIPTGLVIADVEYDLVATVKKTFESSNWTLRGDNTLVLVDAPFTWEMTALIRYTIEDNNMT